MNTMNLRAGAAVTAARIVGILARRVAHGGGTALPGLVAERIAPDLLTHLASQLPEGALVVTGTNGKTTTSHMLARILTCAGRRPLRNASGSNLARGIATTLARHASATGRLHAEPQTIGLFETDEAAFGRVVPQVRPRIVVVTNLFRDQLDRYGEVDTVASVWRTALAHLDGTCSATSTQGVGDATYRGGPPTLVLNADDPTVASLAGPHVFGAHEGAPAVRRGAPAPLYFGIEDARHGRPGPEHASDAKVCPVCGARLAYPVCYYGHLGQYACPHGHRRPAPQVVARRLDLRGFQGTDFSLETPRGMIDLRLPLPGIYNVYNALAAAAGALSAGVSIEAIRVGLEGFTAAFGRLERIAVEGRTCYLVLAKNPVGMNEALRTLFAGGAPQHVLMALNDLDADGRDVSWIWDADFEHAAGQRISPVVSGRRAEDLAVRLKYAGVAPQRIEPALDRAFDAALAQTPTGQTLFAVVTYTAMLELRRLLTERGYVAPYWEQG